jgi:integrase
MNVSTITIKQTVVTFKNFFEYWDIAISPRKIKLNIRISKVARRNRIKIKKDIIEIQNNCLDIRLKTYVMMLVATGTRAVEALDIKIEYIDFDNIPSGIHILEKISKLKQIDLYY